jgi:DNA-binding MarR family transcriptional regulator
MKQHELAVLAHEVSAYIFISAKLMARDIDERLAQHWQGMSAPHFGVLRILACHSLTIKELSERMLLAPSTLVPIVDRLENAGLLVRGRDPDDRRRTPLELTDDARQHLERMAFFDGQDALNMALRQMSADDSRRLRDLLQQLVTDLAHDPEIVRHVQSFAPRAMKPHAGTLP